MKRLFYYTLALTASVVFLSRTTTQNSAQASSTSPGKAPNSVTEQISEQAQKRMPTSETQAK